MKLASRHVGLVVVLFTCAAAVNADQVSMIDRHGNHIPSIFFGASPSVSHMRQLLLDNTAKLATRPYSLLEVNYRKQSASRDRGTGKLLRICGTCNSHYQVDEDRPCGSTCGGSENWTYSDDQAAPYCIGYTISLTGCNTRNCQQELTCPNGLCD